MEKIQYSELATLCDKKTNITDKNDLQKGLVWKLEACEGDKYLAALSKITINKNRNDKPFNVQDIINQPTLAEFEFSGKKDFNFICNLKPQKMILKANSNMEIIVKENERIYPSDFASKEALDLYMNFLGVTYMLTAIVNDVEYIIKFGSTRTTMKDRIGSYNCGTVTNYITASTTNFKILQSIVSTNALFKLYLCQGEGQKNYWFHNVASSPFATSYPLAVEEIMIKEFKSQFNRIPLANIQSNPTKTKK